MSADCLMLGGWANSDDPDAYRRQLESKLSPESIRSTLAFAGLSARSSASHGESLCSLEWERSSAFLRDSSPTAYDELLTP